MTDDAMEWLKANDPDYGQMGEDVYGEVYGISTRPRAFRRQRSERSLSPDAVVSNQPGFDHCPACRRKRIIGNHTVE